VLSVANSYVRPAVASQTRSASHETRQRRRQANVTSSLSSLIRFLDKIHHITLTRFAADFFSGRVDQSLGFVYVSMQWI